MVSLLIYNASFDFYPRSPCGERLGFYADMMALTAISIHALLAESDNPIPHQDYLQNQFLSTLSLRRATKAMSVFKWDLPISIHALLAESDV